MTRVLADIRRNRKSPDRKPRLILHAGTQKTGTTSIQAVLADLREELAQAHIHYPNTRPILGGTDKAHFRLAHALTQVDEREYRDALRFIRMLSEGIGPNDLVILSAEPIYRHLHGEKAWGKPNLADYWSRRCRYVKSLAEAFSAFDTRLLLFLRRPDSYAESLYKELTTLKQDGLNRSVYTSLTLNWGSRSTFSQFLTDFHPLFDYTAQIDLFREAFHGKVDVYCYERAVSGAGVIRTVLDAAGFHAPLGAGDKWERRSPDARLLLWLAMQPGEDEQMFSDFLQSATARALYALDDKVGFWESVEQRNQFLAQFKGEFGSDFFPPPPPNVPKLAVLEEAESRRITEVFERWREIHERDRRIEELTQQVERLDMELMTRVHALDMTRRQLAYRNDAAYRLRRRIDRMQAKWSWKLTRPARFAMDGVKLVVKGAMRFAEETVEKHHLPRLLAPWEGTYPDVERRSVPKPKTPKVAVVTPSAPMSPKGAEQEPDTFVLYRIVGNDLHPRHAQGQSRENVRFILENEPSLEGCEKRWVINRIFDVEIERQILSLLERYEQPYLRIPFDLEEYARAPWNFEAFPRPDFFLHGPFHRLNAMDQELAETRVRSHKNNYAMNNNGARNVALRDGRGRAKWVLPWDGNCCLSTAAWQAIVEAVREKPYLKYFTVPMARLSDNLSILDPKYKPHATEEPQILFRRDAREEFNEAYPYGWRPKVELLMRLGVGGPWDNWVDRIWDPPRLGVSEEAGQVGEAGWVARLFSGQPKLEHSVRSSASSRADARREAIQSTLDMLDERVLRCRYRQGNLTAYDENAVTQLRERKAESDDAGIGMRLRSEAEVESRNGCPGSEPPSKALDRITILTLASQMPGGETYARQAAAALRRAFVDPRTRMDPHPASPNLLARVARRDDRFDQIRELTGLHHVVDSARLLERDEVLDEQTREAFKGWLSDYLAWLKDSDVGFRVCRAQNYLGTSFDLQSASIAAYLGDIPGLLGTLRTSRERLFGQFGEDGSQPHARKATDSSHVWCLNLQIWAYLATLAERCGDGLWGYAAFDGRNLEKAFAWFLNWISRVEWSGPQTSHFDLQRLAPLWAALPTTDGLPTLAKRTSGDLNSTAPRLPQDTGALPFWMLG